MTSGPVETSRLVVITLCEKGGVRKTTTLANLVEHLRDGFADFRIFEVDDQPRLRTFFPGHLQTISLPDLEEVRQDDLADIGAFSPLLDAILDRAAPLIAVDVAASVDSRVLETWLKLNLSGALVDAGYEALVLVPFTLERDALTLAARSIARVELVLPNALVVPVHAETGEAIDKLPPDRRKLLSAVVHARPLIRHPRLLPRSLAAVETIGGLAYRIALMTPNDAGRLLTDAGQTRSEARGCFSELVLWQDAIRKEFERLPFRAGDGETRS